MSPLYLFFGEAFEILTDSIDVGVVRGWLRGSDKEMGHFRGILEVKNVEALGSWFKFKEPI